MKLDSIRSTGSKLAGITQNFRAVQALNGRTVQYSAGSNLNGFGGIYALAIFALINLIQF